MKLGIPCFAVLIVFGCLLARSSEPRKNARLQESFYLGIQRQIQEGKSEQAVQTLRQSISSHPTDIRLRNLLGLAYTSLNQLELADAQFKTALARDPHFIPSLRNLAINEESLGHHEESIRHFRSVLALLPKDPVASAYLGSDRFVQKDYERAYELLSLVGSLKSNPTIKMECEVSRVVVKGGAVVPEDQEVLRLLDLNQVSPSILFLGGVALAEKGDYADASNFLRHLPLEWQILPDVTYDLSLCLIRNHQNVEAATILEAFLGTRQHTGRMLSLAAEAYAADGQIQKAIDSLREATVLEPKVEDHYIDLAEICTQYDAYDVGIEVLSVGLHYLPESDRLYFEKGVLEAMKSDFSSADRDLAKAQALSPQKSMAGLAIGVELMQAGKLQDAISELRTRANRDSNNAVVQYMLAEAILQNGATPHSAEMEEVRTALMQATKSDVNYEPPLVALAKIEVQEKRFESARELLVKAVSLAPKDSNAWSQLAIVDHRLGLKEDAETAVQRLSEINQKQRDDRHQLQISAGPPH